ncbi:hypothetical protein GN956_G15362 [Arapaima gigas]
MPKLDERGRLFYFKPRQRACWPSRSRPPAAARPARAGTHTQLLGGSWAPDAADLQPGCLAGVQHVTRDWRLQSLQSDHEEEFCHAQHL